MLVNELRKKSTDQVTAKNAKTLIKNWKSLLSDKPAKEGSPGENRTPKDENSNLTGNGNSDSPLSNGNANASQSSATSSIKVQSFPKAPSAADDEVSFFNDHFRLFQSSEINIFFAL